MQGDFEDSEHVKFMSHPAMIRNEILLYKYPNETAVGIKYFKDNEERDEQFSVPRRELVIGKEAMFNDTLGSDLVRRKLIYLRFKHLSLLVLLEVCLPRPRYIENQKQRLSLENCLTADNIND